MSKTTIFISGIAAGLIFITSSCGNNNTSSGSMPRGSGEVLATVNGSPITRQDVRYWIKGTKRFKSDVEPGPAKIKQALEDIILQELTYQKAMELGLDNDPVYQEQLLHLQAQLTEFKRKKLSEVFYRQEVNLKVEVTDAEALAYATDNASRLQTEVNIWQILSRDEKEIQQVLADLNQGESFEAVAAKRFPTLPESLRNPWELDYLNWEQIPEDWWDTLNNLDIGETSGIVHSSSRRFRVIKLVDKRDYADYSFESIKPKIRAILKRDKVKKLRESTIRSLRDNANIIYSTP